MIRNVNPIYAYNMTLTESEFLRRELNLKLTKIDKETENALKVKSVFAIATCNPVEIEKILIKCLPNSAIVFFFGNETYDVPQIMWLNQYKDKIKFAYIYNYPKKTSYLVSLRCLIGSIYDGGIKYWNKERNLLRNFKNGIDLMRRTRKLKLNFNYSDFPQGYSKRFVKELIEAEYFSRKGSILKYSPIKTQPKVSTITFVGQTGSWCRTLAISVLGKVVPTFSPTFTYGWGGSNEGEKNRYVQELARSKFALNPPGNLTNRTHRYLESLIMNSLPVMPPSTLQDPHLWGVWSEYLKPISFSWVKQLRRTLSLNSKIRNSIIKSALEFEKTKIDTIKINLGHLYQNKGTTV
jgi:hypothetical protein